MDLRNYFHTTRSGSIVVTDAGISPTETTSNNNDDLVLGPYAIQSLTWEIFSIGNLRLYR